MAKPADKPEYAFCEMVTASSLSPWHIRKLTSRGLIRGGGADTLALCGRKVSWDLAVLLSRERVDADYCCVECSQMYRCEGTYYG